MFIPLFESAKNRYVYAVSKQWNQWGVQGSGQRVRNVCILWVLVASILLLLAMRCHKGFEMASICSVFGRRSGEGGRRRGGLYVGSGSRLSLGDCWISGTQISPTCEAGCNEKMGRGVDAGIGEGEEMDQEGRRLRNITIRWTARRYPASGGLGYRVFSTGPQILFTWAALVCVL
jgi:hypothetical protein